MNNEKVYNALKYDRSLVICDRRMGSSTALMTSVSDKLISDNRNKAVVIVMTHSQKLQAIEKLTDKLGKDKVKRLEQTGQLRVLTPHDLTITRGFNLSKNDILAIDCFMPTTQQQLNDITLAMSNVGHVKWIVSVETNNASYLPTSGNFRLSIIRKED